MIQPDTQTQVPGALSIPFSLGNPWKFPLHGLPLRCSIPYRRGRCSIRRRSWRWWTRRGRTARRSGGALHLERRLRRGCADGLRGVAAARASKRYTLRPRGRRRRGSRARHRDGGGRRVPHLDTGRLRWKFSKTRFSLANPSSSTGATGPTEKPATCASPTRRRHLRATQANTVSRWKKAGRIRVVVRLEGNTATAKRASWNYTVRLHFTPAARKSSCSIIFATGTAGGRV